MASEVSGNKKVDLSDEVVMGRIIGLLIKCAFRFTLIGLGLGTLFGWIVL